MSRRSKKRAAWTEKSLSAAMSAVCNGRKSTYTASTRYGIPKTTLRRRIKSGKIDKTLGRHATFSQDQERDLVDRLIGLSELGKPLTSQTIRLEAFDFSQELNIPNNFNKILELAGKDWLRLFLKRNPDLKRFLI